MSRRAVNSRELPRPGTGESGFTFVEIMIALAVGAIVIVGMYQGFNILHKWWISTGIRSEMRQNARAGLETVTRDIEMAGYQTTNYGDVNKTGLAITLAALHEIEMDQQQPDSATIGTANPVYEPRIVYYHLATDLKSGRQHLYRQIRSRPGLPAPDELVAENVSAFVLGYLDRDNNKFKGPGDPDDPADLPNPPYLPGTQYATGTLPAQYSFGSPPPAVLRDIRRIHVTLTTIPARAVPFGPAPKPFTLMASVMPQNLAAADEVARCPAPPATPTGLEVIDTQSCGNKLRVRWNHNSDPALAGYRLFYGPTGGIDVPVRTVAGMAKPEVTLNPPDLLITKDADRTTAPNTYAIQVLAYDTCGNRGERSAAVSANPASDGTVFGGPNGNDTTVNPLKPTAPTGFTVNARADEELDISWESGVSATLGYRLYRSTAAFAAGHIDGSLQIAGEAILKVEATDSAGTYTFNDLAGSFTYKDRLLDSCTEYHYALAAVNCDETLVAGYHYNGTSAGDYAVASGEWRETTPPPTPSLAGSHRDDSLAFITLTNPLEGESPDFDRTEIYWSKPPAAEPGLNGIPIPNSDSGSPGAFKKRGSQVIVFDRETMVNPPSSLVPGDTYNFLAVSYDRCGNSAPSVILTLVPLPETCVDTDPAALPPGNFLDSNYSSCQLGGVQIEWEYTPREADFAGFRVERFDSVGTGVNLTAGPTLLSSWIDDGPFQAGGQYYYEIRATDCLYDEAYYPLHSSLPYRIPLADQFIRPGRLQPTDDFVTSISDASIPYTYHNNVNFHLQNTSRSRMTIERMAVSWGNTNVVLDSVSIGSNSPVGGAASGVAFPVGVEIAEVASGVGSPSIAVPVLLRFTTPSGVVNRLTDMRNERLEISLWVGDQNTANAMCPTPLRMTIDVPRGPELGFFSQSAPGWDGINSYAVPGPSGTARDTDIKVSTGIGVNVFGTAVDYSRDLFPSGGFATLKVVGADAGTAGTTVVPTMPTSGTFDLPLFSIGCDPLIGGDRYAISQTTPACGNLMPAAGDVRWYYALAVDQTGNWDRLPNPDYGNYAYAQTTFDVCTHTPNAPTDVVATKTGTGVLLTWEAPTLYDDATVIVDDDILTYDVFLSLNGDSGWPGAPGGLNRSSLRYDHSAPASGSYRYRVRAKNACQPTGPRVSVDSLASNEVTLP